MDPEHYHLRIRKVNGPATLLFDARLNTLDPRHNNF